MVMFLLLSVGQSKRNKTIKEVIADVKKRRGRRSVKSSDQQQINQSIVRNFKNIKNKRNIKRHIQNGVHKCMHSKCQKHRPQAD